MDRVYSNATSVIVWLGEPAQEDIRNASWRRRRHVLLGSALYNTQPCWHQRAWVTQEFVHARKRYICAGDLFFEYRAKKFKNMGYKGRKSYPRDSIMYKQLGSGEGMFALQAKLANMNALASFGLQEEHIRRPDIVHYLNSFRETVTCSTDPRDMVYSLLSLITPEEAQIIGSDYNITTGQVYAKATYASFIVRDNLDLLFGKPLHSRPYTVGLPCWAFDFGLPPSFHIKIPRTISYHTDMRPRHIRLDADKLTLRIRGQCFDIIKESMELGTDDHLMKGQFANAFFGVLRDLRMAARTQSLESSPILRMGTLLKSVPDPDLDRWLSRILEGSSSTQKIVLGAFLQYWNEVFELPAALQTCKDIDDKLLEVLDQYYDSISSGAAIYVTETGFIGLAPKTITAGDKIVLLPNEQHALILRRCEDIYTFHGLAYVHGLVDGRLIEAVQDDEPGLEEFVLK